MFELIYTAAPKGLLQGRSGFSTVAMTTGFPPNLIPPIENMSGFRNLYMPGDPHAARNPVNCICQPLRLGSMTLLVVSRIEYAGLSYTGRSNTLAHHYIFTADDPILQNHSPASLLQEKSNFPAWQGEPRLLPEKSDLAAVGSLQNCATWEALTGSADWGRVIANMVKREMPPSVVLEFDPLKYDAENILSLISEVSAQLSPKERQKFTFSTYCYQSSIDNLLFLRAYPTGSTLLDSIKWLKQEHVLTLGENNAIPEKYRDLLHQPIPAAPVVPDVTAAPKKIPPKRPDFTVSVKTSQISRKIHSAAASKAGKSAAAEPPSRRGWIAVAAAVGILLLLSALFFRIQSSEKRNAGSSASDVVLPSSAEKVVPVKKTPVVAAPIAPAKRVPPPKDSVKKKDAPAPVVPVIAPEVSTQAWFDFYLALHDGKTEIPLPDALKGGRLQRLHLSYERATQTKLTKSFDSENGVIIMVFDVKVDYNNPLTPVNIPDMDKVFMRLSISNDRLQITSSKADIDKIDSITFRSGSADVTFYNRFENKYWDLAIPRIAIDPKLNSDQLELFVNYPESDFMNQKIRRDLQLQVTTDQETRVYPIGASVPLPQWIALTDFLRSRAIWDNADKKVKEKKSNPVFKPVFLTEDLLKRLKKTYPKKEELDDIRAREKKAHTLEMVEKLKSDICVDIYKARNRNKEWEEDQKVVRDEYRRFEKQTKDFAKYQEALGLLSSQEEKAAKDLEEKRVALEKYPWCREILEKNPNLDDKEMRELFKQDYLKKIQVKIVRKSEK